MSVSGSQDKTFKTAPSAYAVFGIILGIPTACIVSMMLMRTTLSAVLGVVTCVAAIGFVFAWLRSFRVTITPTELTYHSLTQHRSIERQKIRSVKFSVEPLKGASDPTVRITITASGETEPLLINAKVFGRDAVAAILRLDPSRASSPAAGDSE
jgi:hypothetical protein